jgi:hypothetical protein
MRVFQKVLLIFKTIFEATGGKTPVCIVDITQVDSTVL